MQNKGVVLDKQKYGIPDRSVNLRESSRKGEKKGKAKSVKKSAFFIFEAEGKTQILHTFSTG